MEKRQRARLNLERLLRESTAYSEKGFAVDVKTAAESWHRAICALGRKQAYALLSDSLCRSYRQRFGKEFLFSEACVADELRIHIDALFSALGLPGFRRSPLLWLFPKKLLISRCGVVDISTDDVRDLKQRLVFRYRRGIRPCYKNTPADPFHRVSLRGAKRRGNP